MSKCDLVEGKPLARLLGSDGQTIVALLYQWTYGDLGIFWMGAERKIAFIDRKIERQILTKASRTVSGEIIQFLESLPVKQIGGAIPNKAMP